MADTMTLEQVRDWLRAEAKTTNLVAVEARFNLFADAIDAAIKQHEQGKLDAARMEWYFGPSDKKDWLDTYMLGMREGWSVGQWRAAIDSAMAKEPRHG